MRMFLIGLCAFFLMQPVADARCFRRSCCCVQPVNVVRCFNANDNGKEVTVPVGTTLVITLSEVPNERMKWGILENNKSILGVISEVGALVNVPQPPTKTRWFTMKAAKPGQSNLKIVYFPEGQEANAGSVYTKEWKLFVTIR